MKKILLSLALCVLSYVSQAMIFCYGCHNGVAYVAEFWNDGTFKCGWTSREAGCTKNEYHYYAYRIVPTPTDPAGNSTSSYHEQYLNENFFPDKLSKEFPAELGSQLTEVIREDPSPDGVTYVYIGNLRPDLQEYFKEN